MECGNKHFCENDETNYVASFIQNFTKRVLKRGGNIKTVNILKQNGDHRWTLNCIRVMIWTV